MLNKVLFLFKGRILEGYVSLKLDYTPFRPVIPFPKRVSCIMQIAIMAGICGDMPMHMQKLRIMPRLELTRITTSSAAIIDSPLSHSIDSRREYISGNKGSIMYRDPVTRSHSSFRAATDLCSRKGSDFYFALL